MLYLQNRELSQAPRRATSSKEPSEIIPSLKNPSPANLRALAANRTYLAPRIHPCMAALLHSLALPSLLNTFMFCFLFPH